ncbi:MAG: hypothetical protein JXL81_04925 [Deltaproteobacteria bacterium]|nr:hypothetical protein [Deltaproteobacteria bacterium]
MEISLFNKSGDAVAYISDDYDRTIYFWDGQQIAYLYNERLIFGTNGKHLGWFIDGIIFNTSGERIGFKASTCPVPPSKEPIKLKKKFKYEIQPRWKENPLPKLLFALSPEDFYDFLKNGQVYNPRMSRR